MMSGVTVTWPVFKGRVVPPNPIKKWVTLLGLVFFNLDTHRGRRELDQNKNWVKTMA